MNLHETEPQPEPQRGQQMWMLLKPWEEGVLTRYVDGRNFLTNYYQVLGVNGLSTDEEIHSAYLAKAREYHPDRYEGLAEEHRLDAGYTMGIINRAYQTLSNPEKKLAYSMQLGTWRGPISPNGKPVYFAGRPFYGSENSEEAQAFERQISAQARELVSFDQNTFDLIETMHTASDSPDRSLTDAYKNALARKQDEIDVEEMVKRASVGIDYSETNSPPLAYLETTRAELEAQRNAFLREIVAVNLLSEGSQVLIGSSSADDLDDDQDSTDLEVQSAALSVVDSQRLEWYDGKAAEIEELARQKQELIDKRLALVDGTYPEGQEGYQDKLLIRIQAGEGKSWFAFARNENGEVRSNEEVDPSALPVDDDPKLIDFMKGMGYSIMHLVHESGIPIGEMLKRALMKHYERLEQQNDTSSEEV